MTIRNRFGKGLPSIDWNSLPLFLDETLASTVLGLSLSFLRKSRCEKLIGNRTPGPPFVKIGIRRFYRTVDLKAWAEGLEGHSCT